MSCVAPPGFYCTQNRILACEERFYCTGGNSPAIQCAMNKWAPAQSSSIEACVEHFDHMLWIMLAMGLLLVIGIYMACFWQSEPPRPVYCQTPYVYVDPRFCANQPLCAVQARNSNEDGV